MERYKTILQYDLNNNFIKEWDSVKSIKQAFNKNNSCGDISACINGKQKTAFGYIWKFKKD